MLFLHYAMIWAATMERFYNKEVCWLSRGKGLTRFFELRDELKVLFTDLDFHLSDRLHDDEFLTRLCYLYDVVSTLNYLNLGLQGLSATILIVRDTIEAIEATIKKFELFVRINKDNTQVFPSLYDFFCVQMNSSLRTMSNVI